MSTRLDLDGDELIDLAVGAHGSAVLLRWVGKFGKHEDFMRFSSSLASQRPPLVFYSLSRLKVTPRFVLTSPQLSKHSPDQRESLLPATFHQRHPEDLPERRQRIGLSERHGLLYHALPLPHTTEQQLWYNQFTHFVDEWLEGEAAHAHHLPAVLLRPLGFRHAGRQEAVRAGAV